jgi:hypothetical protein
VEQRDRDAARVVKRRVHGVERRLERKERRDHLDRLVQATRHRTRRHQRQERDRQRQHEREQRRRADLARDCPERDPHGAERHRPTPQRREPEREAAPVQVNEQGQAGHHHERHDERAGGRETDLLDEQRAPAHEAPDESAERVLLALERERSRRQEQRDEHERHAHRDGDGERAERRRAALHHRRVHLDRLADRGEHVVREADVLLSERGELDDLVDLLARG